MRILLTGATGCVGAAFVRRAKDDPGLEVVATARGRSGDPPAGVAAWIRSPLAGLPDRLEDLGPIDACVHAAAVVHRPDTPEARVRAVNVDATTDLAEALVERSPGIRFVFVSSIAAMEPRRSAYGRSKADAEAALRRIARDRALDLVTLRLATVYGPGDRGNIGSLARAVARGVYVRTAPRGVRKTLVWSEAVASSLRAAVDPTRVPATTAVIADPRPYTLGEIEDALAEALGVRPPRRIPPPLPLGLAAAGSAVRRLTGIRLPFDMGTLRTLGRDVVAPRTAEGSLAEAVEAALAGTSLPERLRAAYRAFDRPGAL